jgi:hypothetical protein
MSAERGWIADLPPQREHHTPGWLSEKGTGRSHFHSDKYAAKQDSLPADDLVPAPNILRETAELYPLSPDDAD